MSVVDPVFVDRSGRRRRLFTGLGSGLAALLVVGSMLLIAGLLGSSPVPLPGLPQGGQGGQHRDAGSGVGSAPGRTGAPASPAPSERTAGSGGTTATRTSGPAGSPPASEPHDNRRTSHPGTPKPSRTK